MLEEIYNLDDRLSEDEYYDALLFLLGDAYPELDEEELEDLLEDMLDQLPEQYAENVMNTIGAIGKQIGSGALKFASNNPDLVKGALTAAGTIVGGPIGSKLGSGLGNIITGAGQNKFLPETGKTLALMQNPQAQAAITRATLGIGNGIAPLAVNGNMNEVPIATYLRAIIVSAQAALQELDRNKIIPPQQLIESIPFSDNVDEQASWVIESLLGDNEKDCILTDINKIEIYNCDLSIDGNGYAKGNRVTTQQYNSTVVPKSTQGTTFKAIILHRTAGSNIQSAIQDKKGKGAHFYIGGGNIKYSEDGKIFQAVSLNNATSHINNDDNRISQKNIKTYNSIGIEIIGLAYYFKNGKLYKEVNPPEVVSELPKLTKLYENSNPQEGRHWDELTVSQIESTVCLLKLLMNQYNIKPEMIFTHEEIQSKRPGEGQAVKDALCKFLKEKQIEQRFKDEIKRMNLQFNQKLLAEPDALKVKTPDFYERPLISK